MSKETRSLRTGTLFVPLCLLLAGGCSDGGPVAEVDADAGPTPAADVAVDRARPAFVIRPRVFFKGRVKGARLIQVTRLDVTARGLVPVRHDGCEATDDTGGCELTLHGAAGHYLLEFSGGFDDHWVTASLAAKHDIPRWIPTTATLRSLVTLKETERDRRPVVVVSPLTDQGAARLLYLLVQGKARGDENASINTLMELDVTRLPPHMPYHLESPSDSLRYGLVLVALSKMADRGGVSREQLVGALHNDIRADGVQDGRDAKGPMRIEELSLGPRTMKSQLLLRLRWLIYSWTTGDTLESKDIWPWIERATVAQTDVYPADAKPTCPDPIVKLEVPTESNPGVTIEKVTIDGEEETLVMREFKATVESTQAVVSWLCYSNEMWLHSEANFKQLCSKGVDVRRDGILGTHTIHYYSGKNIDSMPTTGEVYGGVWVKTDCGSEAMVFETASYSVTPP
jgi:hypothetical protein